MGIIKKTRGKDVLGALILDHGTDTAVAGAVTLNKMSGVITTAALTTAAAADYTLTVTNNKIAAADIVLASVQYGSCTQGTPTVYLITPAAGSFVLKLQNAHASDALDGTLKISYAILKGA